MPRDFDHIARREDGLQRKLTAGQMSMIAIGGAIGTGLFLGSKFAIGIAGPSVLEIPEVIQTTEAVQAVSAAATDAAVRG